MTVKLNLWTSLHTYNDFIVNNGIEIVDFSSENILCVSENIKNKQTYYFSISDHYDRNGDDDIDAE